jgi:hypothetical protein
VRCARAGEWRENADADGAQVFSALQKRLTRGRLEQPCPAAPDCAAMRHASFSRSRTSSPMTIAPGTGDPAVAIAAGLPMRNDR